MSMALPTSPTIHDMNVPTAILSDLSDDSDASTQVGDHNGDNDADASLDSHTSSQLPDDQSIDSIDSAKSIRLIPKQHYLF